MAQRCMSPPLGALRSTQSMSANPVRRSISAVRPVPSTVTATVRPNVTADPTKRGSPPSRRPRQPRSRRRHPRQPRSRRRHPRQPRSDADTHANPGRDADTHANPGRDADTHANPGRDADTHANPGRDADTHANPFSGKPHRVDGCRFAGGDSYFSRQAWVTTTATGRPSATADLAPRPASSSRKLHRPRAQHRRSADRVRAPGCRSNRSKVRDGHMRGSLRWLPARTPSSSSPSRDA